MSAMERILQELAGGARILLDGATGTELEHRGAAMHERAWCAMATLTAPDLLRAVHEDYIRAGARVITTNTFSTSRNMLEPAGLGAHFEEVNRKAVAIALQARDELGAGDRVVVAGSMSHQIPIVHGTDNRDHRQVPSLRAAKANFQEMAALLKECGVDLLLMEMMSDPDLANLAMDAARATGLPVWAGFSVRQGPENSVVAYSRQDLDVDEMLAATPLDGIQVAGIMHSTVTITGAALKALHSRFRGPLMAYPDSGYFVTPHWQFKDIISPEDLVAEAKEWMDQGVQVIGGCCGLGLEHIQALAAAMD